MNHFHFSASDTLATIQFYEQYFGFRKIRSLKNTHVLTDNSGFLLAIDESNDCTSLPQTCHLGFTLPSAERVRQTYQNMLQEKVQIIAPLQMPSAKAIHFYCQDPAGNTIEVGWYNFLSTENI